MPFPLSSLGEQVAVIQLLDSPLTGSRLSTPLSPRVFLLVCVYVCLNTRCALCQYLSALSFIPGLVNKLLSASFWIPLSRLTYTAYLVHLIAISVFFGSFETVVAYSDVHLVSHRIAHAQLGPLE